MLLKIGSYIHNRYIQYLSLRSRICRLEEDPEDAEAEDGEDAGLLSCLLVTVDRAQRGQQRAAGSSYPANIPTPPASLRVD